MVHKILPFHLRSIFLVHLNLVLLERSPTIKENVTIALSVLQVMEQQPVSNVQLGNVLQIEFSIPTSGNPLHGLKDSQVVVQAPIVSLMVGDLVSGSQIAAQDMEEILLPL
mmetsp:Transcript_25650/g.36032  ORF Transcript_25650/g.36032 Transcript_25650/m.36032 type:complete len:111 (+) Transcript_25650:1156-1488(+)